MANFIYKHRRGTTAALNDYDIPIHDGEIVVEEIANIDSARPSQFKIKVGDGVHTFSELPYALADPNDHNHDGRYYTEAEINELLEAHTSDVNNPHEVTASQVGLGNVDNTSDANKPISTAQQTAFDSKLGLHATADKAVADASGNTIATTYATKTELTTHNAAVDAHNDIRVLITGLTTRLNALADSDDTTLDQLSEIVAYIQSNRSLIESVTTNKVNVTDIINNLTTNITDKPLSAAQGVALKTLIDTIEIPTNVSAFINDAGYLTTHQDISSKANVADLATVATSGSYEDLSNKPDIAGSYTLPEATSDILGGVKVGVGLSITDGVLSTTGGGIADGVEWSNITDKPIFAPVATSGSYDDLSDKPDIAGAYTLPTASSDTLGGVKVGAGVSISDGVLSTDPVAWDDVTDKPSLATVATSGSYNDLSDKPTVTNGADGAPGAPGSSGVYIGEEAPTDTDINVWVDTNGTPDPVAKKYNFTATALSTGWTGEAAPYSQTINVLGILSTDKPYVDLVPSDTFATAESEIEGWSFIYDIQTATGTVTLYATDTPTVDLNVQMEVFR